MNKTTCFEIVLVVLICFVWLGPLFLSLRRREFSVIHPSTIFPLWVIIEILVSMTEHWFGWKNYALGRNLIHGLRLTTRSYYCYDDLFLNPLLIVFLTGFTYHYGVFKGCGRFASERMDGIYITERFKSVVPRNTMNLFIVGIVFSLICIAPFILFGQDSGFFWAAALIYASNFIPVLWYNQHNKTGILFVSMGLLIIGIRGSKGDYIYYLLPLFLFNYRSLFFGQQGIKIVVGRIIFFIRKIRFIRLLLIGVIIVALVYGTKRIFTSRGIALEETPFIYEILKREYSFEVFSILVHEISPLGEISKGSWIYYELIEMLPGVLGVEKFHVGQKVARDFLPDDYAIIPEAGFGRFFLFDFYHDFGWIGAIFGGWFFGFFFGRIYKYALSKTYKMKVLWPLIAYLPIPIYSEMWVNGAISYYLIHVMIGSFVIWMIARLSTINVI